ncbi:hypothetical protein F5H01DRAFT_66996 [Linnemannia elongata]|nr:hypothetical protein F5H01DRAFT_66996 [Linnemannia elongata]
MSAAVSVCLSFQSFRSLPFCLSCLLCSLLSQVITLPILHPVHTPPPISHISPSFFSYSLSPSLSTLFSPLQTTHHPSLLSPFTRTLTPSLTVHSVLICRAGHTTL